MRRAFQTLLFAFVTVLSLTAFGRAMAQNSRIVSVTPAGAFAEAREPQAAVGAAGRVFVTYGMKNAVYCSTSPDSGLTYAAPVKVGEAGVLSLGMQRGPRIAVTDKAVVITAVYGGQGMGRDEDLLAWRSQDQGKTWQGPSRVNDAAGAAREGLSAMAASPEGTLACAWLDLRGKGTKIYAATSKDGGAAWDTNHLVYQSPDGTVCECCHPSVAYDARGRLYVMWRNWLGGSRDMYLTRSEDGGKTFAPAQKLGTGTWPLNACPMDGGAVAIAADGTATTFWQRSGKMYECAPGGTEHVVGGGVQGWMANGAAGVYCVWLERRGGTLMARLSGGSAITLSSGADDPVIVCAPDNSGPARQRCGRRQRTALPLSSVSLYRKTPPTNRHRPLGLCPAATWHDHRSRGSACRRDAGMWAESGPAKNPARLHRAASSSRA